MRLWLFGASCLAGISYGTIAVAIRGGVALWTKSGIAASHGVHAFSRDTRRAMSAENVKIVRDAFAAFERGDVTELLDLMTDDLVTHRIDPDDAMYYGKEGFFEAMAEWVEDFDDWTLTPEEFFDASGGVVVRVRQTARGRTSGVPVESLMWFDLQIVRGRIARLTFHTDPAKAFEAAGLSE